ncbi:MAG: hypothetical protein OXD45_14135 [Rhodobacteraceae bacterium]|nr:hypothetical protein [Paracoccaceae bacterium]
MTKTKSPKPRKNQSKYYKEFPVIKDSPENVAKAIMKQPPKKDWRFLAKKNG